MPRLHEARGPTDDWTGLSDPKARRKLQNRLNVRAHRKRKAPTSQSTSTSNQLVSSEPLLPEPPAPLLTHADDDEKPCSFPDPQPRDYSQIISATFPISLDHLIPLIRYNLMRASVTNARILALQQSNNLDRCGPIWERMPLFPAAPTSVPTSLRPTPLQRAVPHDVWIDLLPDRTLRDNTLRLVGTPDIAALWKDLSGSLCGADADGEAFAGLVVWRDPWCADGWEMSEGFVRKWAGLLTGCWELLAATNRWRERRGEEPLVVEL